MGAIIPYVFALGGLVALIVWAIAVVAIDRWREWHHVWIGVALVILGVGIQFVAPVAWFFAVGLGLAALGNWIAWDDALAHNAQAHDPEYHRIVANFLPGTMGSLDAPYSWWHRFAARHRVIG